MIHFSIKLQEILTKEEQDCIKKQVDTKIEVESLYEFDINCEKGTFKSCCTKLPNFDLVLLLKLEYDQIADKLIDAWKNNDSQKEIS